eukprot:1841355-Prymnesium_polylepis.1
MESMIHDCTAEGARARQGRLGGQLRAADAQGRTHAAHQRERTRPCTMRATKRNVVLRARAAAGAAEGARAREGWCMVHGAWCNDA